MDVSGQQVPTRDTINVQYGVTYCEPPDSSRQTGAIKLGGISLNESPEFKNKMNRTDLINKQISEKGSYALNMLDRNTLN